MGEQDEKQQQQIILEKADLGITPLISALQSGDEKQAIAIIRDESTDPASFFAKEKINFTDAMTIAINKKMADAVVAMADRADPKQLNPYKQRIEGEMGSLDYLIEKSHQKCRPMCYREADKSSHLS